MRHSIVRSYFLHVLTLSLAMCARAADRLPASLFFVANEGQWEATFAFKAGVSNAIFYITSSGMTIDFREYLESPPTSVGGQKGVSSSALPPLQWGDQRGVAESDIPPFTGGQRGVAVRGHVLRFTYLNANPSPEIIGEDKLSSYSNYFLGRDSCQWRSFVGHYQKVRMKDVWNGIDVEYGIRPEGIETLYRVQAGADASQIVVQYEGLDAPLRLDNQGNLLLQTSLGTIKEKAPFAYQIVNHRQIEVSVQFHVLANDMCSLSFEAFDAGQELVIDPLVYSTFLGGEGPDAVGDAALGPNGRIVVVGWTDASDFPVTPGAYQTQSHNQTAGFMTAFCAIGDSVLFSTYVAAPTGVTYLNSAIIDNRGAVYATGRTTSPRWPTTPNAYDTTYNGDWDGVVLRLSPSGTALEYGTFIGGPNFDIIYNSGRDSMGFIYLCGGTFGGFPTTPDALFPGSQFGGFVAVLDSSLSTLLYSSNTPGHTAEAHSLCLNNSGNLWVSGTISEPSLQITPNAAQPTYGGEPNDCFVSQWDLRRNRLAYCSYLGGNRDDADAMLSLGPQQRVILCGGTSSGDFPVTTYAYDTLHDSTGEEYHTGFVTVLDTMTGIVASTYLGGTEGEYVSVAVMKNGRIIVAGETYSADFPVTRGAFDTLLNGNGQAHSGLEDLFMSCLDTSLSHLIYSTFIGGSGNDFGSARMQNRDTVWMFGQTGSSDFPITPNAYQTQNHFFGDGFLLGFVLPESLSAAYPRATVLPDNPMLSIYPNPFNPSTTISFSLPKASLVRFDVFDILGRNVYRADLGRMNAGTHQQLFNLPGLASGTYIVRLNAGTSSISRKMMVIR